MWKSVFALRSEPRGTPRANSPQASVRPAVCLLASLCCGPGGPAREGKAFQFAIRLRASDRCRGDRDRRHVLRRLWPRAAHAALVVGVGLGQHAPADAGPSHHLRDDERGDIGGARRQRRREPDRRVQRSPDQT
jgi:hypothetical protein